ncbi:MAG: O-antigen ligase family protein [Acidobacteriota bacterium]|nr:O-antigen ligase family protein [Acidobacteriota bacterium]
MLALLFGIAAVITIARLHAAGIVVADAITLFLIAGILLAAALMVGTNWVEKWPAAASLAELFPRLIRGLPGAEDGFHPNAGAGALLVFLPSALQAAASRAWPARLRLVGRVAAVMIGFVLILTQSRGAIAGMTLGTALTAALIAPGRTRRRLQSVTAVAATVALIGLILLFAAPARLERIAGPHLVEGLSSRIELWDRTASEIWDHRWSGLGFNGFRNQIQAEQPLFLFEPSDRPPHAHNALLQTAADLGLAGLAIYLMLLVMVTVDLARIAKAGAAISTRAAAAALLAGWLAHLSFGLADAIPLGTKVGLVFWLTVGLAAVLVADDQSHARVV